MCSPSRQRTLRSGGVPHPRTARGRRRRRPRHSAPGGEAARPVPVAPSPPKPRGLAGCADRRALGGAAARDGGEDAAGVRLAAPARTGDRRIETRPAVTCCGSSRGSSTRRRSSNSYRRNAGLGRTRALARAGARDVRGERFALVAAERLEESRLAALEGRIDADLDAGRHAAIVGELEQLAEEHPLRERLRAQLMLALYRSGRQAEALEVYRRTRERLADELGLEPGASCASSSRRSCARTPGCADPSGDGHAASPRRPPHAARGGCRSSFCSASQSRSPWFRTRPNHTHADLQAFAVKVENILGQAHDGRSRWMHAVDAAFCKIAGTQAAAQIDDVIANRNSLLQQIAALNVPNDARAQRAASLLQQAAAASFAADVGYRRTTRGSPLSGEARQRCDRARRPAEGRVRLRVQPACARLLLRPVLHLKTAPVGVLEDFVPAAGKCRGRAARRPTIM